MASYVMSLYQEHVEDNIPYADPRTADWLLLNKNPWYVWILTVIYLLLVWLLPKYMRHRQAYSMQTFMVVYNMALVVLSAYMFIEILLSTSAAGYEWMCAPYNEKTRLNPKELRVAKVLWWYFFSKAIELLDTILMALRKKNAQITFLHVFHHMSMLNIWWWVMMFTPGGLSYFGSGLNSLVHVVMYSYYGLSVIPSLRGKLWWKKYITNFQLLQFGITLTHTVTSMISGCEFPQWGKNLLGGYMIAMLILFMNFYIRSYVLAKKKKQSRKESSANGTTPVQNGSSSNGAALITNGTPHLKHHTNNGIHAKKAE